MANQEDPFEDKGYWKALESQNEHLEEEARQEWLQDQLSELSQAAIEDAVNNAHQEINAELSTRSAEIQFANQSSYPNLFAVSCLLAMEKISRELVSIPVLTAIFSSNPKKLHNSNFLIGFLDRNLSVMEFLFDVFRTYKGHGALEKTIDSEINQARIKLGVDGFFVKSQGSGPQKLENWIDLIKKFRNALMHGRQVATREQAEFVFNYFSCWLRIIHFIIHRYGIRLGSNFPYINF